MKKINLDELNDLMLELYNFRDRIITEINEQKSPDDILEVFEKRMKEVKEFVNLGLDEITTNVLNSMQRKTKKARYISP